MLKLSPNSFHFRITDLKSKEELQSVCDIINSMTDEQKLAVEMYGKSNMEDGFDDGYRNHQCSYCG